MPEVAARNASLASSSPLMTSTRTAGPRLHGLDELGAVGRRSQTCGADRGDRLGRESPCFVRHRGDRGARSLHRRRLEHPCLPQPFAQPRHLGAVDQLSPGSVRRPLGEVELHRVRADVDDPVPACPELDERLEPPREAHVRARPQPELLDRAADESGILGPPRRSCVSPASLRARRSARPCSRRARSGRVACAPRPRAARRSDARPRRRTRRARTHRDGGAARPPRAPSAVRRHRSPEAETRPSRRASIARARRRSPARAA